MNEQFTFMINNRVYSGEGSLGKLATLIVEHGFIAPGIIVDENLYNNCKVVSEVVDNIKTSFKSIVYFYNYNFEPSYQLLEEIRSEFGDDGKAKVDCMIGIGGGSVLDTAKGIAILAVNSGPALGYKGFPKDIIEPLPMIAVPSTAGTGSELVYNASFIDESIKVKMGINYTGLYPVFAVLDPRIPASAPKSVFASSGCDALVHALESFVSTSQNQISRIFSTVAIRKILKNFPLILGGSQDLHVWSEMQWAAYFAMIGLSNTSSGPSGALSYYIGTNFKVPHGFAGGIFIGEITLYNHSKGYHDYAEIYESEGGDANLSDKEKSQYIVESINELIKLAGIKKLSGYNFCEDDISGVMEFYEKAKAAFDFNPVAITDNDLRLILKNIL